MNKVYPVGYNGPHGDIVATIMQDPNAYLCDIRLSPQSQWRPEWRRVALVKQYGSERYHHIPLLGNLNYKNGGPIEIADPERGIAALCSYLRDGHDLVLLCQCAHYKECHRKVVVDLLLQAMPEVSVVLSATPVHIVEQATLF